MSRCFICKRSFTRRMLRSGVRHFYTVWITRRRVHRKHWCSDCEREHPDKIVELQDWVDAQHHYQYEQIAAGVMAE